MQWQIESRRSKGRRLFAIRAGKGVFIDLRSTYAIIAVSLIAIESAIAAFVHDGFVRPYLGDSLAVALVYAGIRALTPLGIGWSLAAALAIACLIEGGQWLGLLNLLGLERSTLARIVLGTGFDVRDFLAYAAGGGIVLVGEAAAHISRKRRSS